MITLNTIIYEGNFKELLKKDSWFFTFNSKFVTSKTITVNNINNWLLFNDLINKLSNEFNFKLIFIDHDKLKQKYKLNINYNTIGYNYTIPYFAAIDNIKTKYILNVASDCMKDIKISDDYLVKSMYELDNNQNCLTTMISWVINNKIMLNNRRIGEHEEIETFKILKQPLLTNDNFNLRYNFTDQFFMGDINHLNHINYNLDENISINIYNGPKYGGNSFEKRMVNYQINNNVYNCIYKGDDYYIHDDNYFN